MTESGPSGDRGVVSGQAVVDFSHLTSAEELAAISRIESVAAVVVPESLAARTRRSPPTAWPGPSTCLTARTYGYIPAR